MIAIIRRNTPRRANIATRRARANSSSSKALNRARGFLQRPRRSVLFVPGSSERMLEKARTLACDVVVLDLEDSVAPQAKQAARTAVCAAVRNYGEREVVVRINPRASPEGQADLQAGRAARP